MTQDDFTMKMKSTFSDDCYHEENGKDKSDHVYMEVKKGAQT